MIKNDFCVDITDRELDYVNLHKHLDKLLELSSDINWTELNSYNNVSFVLSKEFILFMDYLERMEYIPALVLLRGHLTEDMYRLISRLCKFNFFANMRYFYGNSKDSIDRSLRLLEDESLVIDPNDKIYVLQNISIIDNLNELAEKAKVIDLSYSDACYYAVISYAISSNR